MTLEELRARLPCRIHAILRLETLAQELILRHERFDAVVDAFVGTVEGARAAGHVGLKSIIAYRTGLAVGTRAARSRRAFRPLRARRDARAASASLPSRSPTTSCGWRSTRPRGRRCPSSSTPASGTPTSISSRRTRSSAALEDWRFASVPFVLLHGAYPYVRELSYLASLYPNVHVDLGLAIPHVASDLPGIVGKPSAWPRRAESCSPATPRAWDSTGSRALGPRALGTVWRISCEGALG